jgi:hypothetical protein
MFSVDEDARFKDEDDTGAEFDADLKEEEVSDEDEKA